MATWGILLTSPDRERSLFLDATEIAGLQQAIEVMTQRPTAAGGTLDVGGLQRLGRALELTNTSHPASAARVDPIVLSSPERSALEMLHEQAKVRDSLPERIRMVCETCGLDRIINPAVAAADQAARQPARDQVKALDKLDCWVTAADLFSAGHPWLGTLALMSAADTNGQKASTTPATTCGRCQGTTFDVTPLTYCPGCREPRDETILLACPDCQFNFRSCAPAMASIWSAPADAADAYLLNAARAEFTEHAADFENGLYPDQRDTLRDMLTKDDRLVALFRCRFPTQAFRSVAVLLTSRALLWARQSAASNVTSDRIEWSTVNRLRPTGLVGTDRFNQGCEIRIDSGAVTEFVDFRGIGLSLDERTHTFDLDGAYHLIAEYVNAVNPQAVVEPLVEPPANPPIPPARNPPAAPPPIRPAPSPPPPLPAPPLPQPAHVRHAVSPPGWLPDPWRQARFRWWDGARWTPFTQ